MAVHTYSSRDFTRDVSAAKRATAKGPVFITDRGRPAYALLKIEDYFQLAGQQEASLLDLMDNIAGGEHIEFDVPRPQPKLRAAKLV
jgi:PHD/YefM family antitoxin component YafN of YafNO toxin-antitoxin module